jgi:hypothetical protein
VEAWFPDMFCNFDLVKNCKTVDTSATTEAREKLSTDLQSLEFWKLSMHIFSRSKINQSLHNKISHLFLETTKLLPGQNTPLL